MTTLEIILLIISLIFIIVSFLISERLIGKKESSLDKEDIRELVSKEIETMKSRMDTNLEEAVDSTLDRTYRDLEKVSNEKIMAVSEYSESVLGEIQKNHKEVIFLYNMLNDKEEKLKETVIKAQKIKTEVKSLIKEAEKKVSINESKEELDNKKQEAAYKNDLGKGPGLKKATDVKVTNNNQEIIDLFEQGISKTDIAKKLGLGLGEVRLVLDLFRGEEK